jgi:hypothetical protein
VIGAGCAEGRDAVGDGGFVAPGDERVDQAVVEGVALLVGEALAAEAGGVRGQAAHEAQWLAGDRAGANGVGFEDDQLLDCQESVGAEDGAGLGDVLGGEEDREGAGGAVAGEGKHARAEGGEHAVRDGYGVQRVEVRIDLPQRVGSVRAAESDDQPARDLMRLVESGDGGSRVLGDREDAGADGQLRRRAEYVCDGLEAG